MFIRKKSKSQSSDFIKTNPYDTAATFEFYKTLHKQNKKAHKEWKKRRKKERHNVKVPNFVIYNKLECKMS